MASNNTNLQQVIDLFPDNANNEISAADMRVFINSIWNDKEVKATRVDNIFNLVAYNSEIYEGSIVLVWNGSTKDIGVYISRINQPLTKSDLIQISKLPTDTYNDIQPITSSVLVTTGNISELDYVTFVDASAGSLIVTLPIATGNNNAVINIKRIDETSNTVTIVASGADTIDNTTTFDISSYESVKLISNGIQWYII